MNEWKREGGRSRTSLLLILAVAGLFITCGPDSDEQRPLNVLIVVLDTLRPDHLGLDGYERSTSPHLDAFAEKAFVFRSAQSAAPWTTPSLTSLLTSLYPDVHGVRTYPDPGRLAEGVTTLAEVLSDAGYETAAFTEGFYAAAAFGMDQGFDSFSGAPEKLVGEKGRHKLLGQNVDRFLSWLKAPRERPFFALFHTYETHYPYHAPDASIQRFRPSYDGEAEHAQLHALVERWNKERLLTEDEFRMAFRHEWHCGDEIIAMMEDLEGAEELVRQLGLEDERGQGAELEPFLKDLYDACVHFTDAQLQRVWAALEAGDLADETLVVVVSDHGEALGEHGLLGQHGLTLHEELLRILLLLRIPGERFEPRDIPQLVQSIDVMPTVLDLLDLKGASDAPPMQGQSLVPLLEGAWEERAAFGHAPVTDTVDSREHSLRTDRWKLIVGTRDDQVQLFDLELDPGETMDMAAEQPDVVATLRAQLDAQPSRDEALRRELGIEVGASGLGPEQLGALRALGYVGER